jgi:hypothetical protein
VPLWDQEAIQAREVPLWDQEAIQAREVPLWDQEAIQARERRKPVRCWFSGKKVPLWDQEARRCWCKVKNSLWSPSPAQQVEP